MSGHVVMLQGTSSSVGKSLLVGALCRIYARRGMRVAPFKAQNMSNNAAVCPDGSEIGRAQAMQAAAARITPTADLNPILLKPEADAHSQVVVMGRPWNTLPARQYYRHKSELWEVVTAALDRLRQQYDLVFIEGAGSPVELNLRAGDIVNMAVAQYAQAPVLLIGDIDRGGIFAQLLGTLWLLEPAERALVQGLIINKFRGDIGLFYDGRQILEERGGVPVLGVVPYVRDLGVPEEDAVALDLPSAVGEAVQGEVDIAVIHLPHISNFDDFDPLAGEPGVRVRYVSALAGLGQPQAIILPGTKSTIADLDWLRRSGLAEAIRKRARAGASVVGVCGGYQMLGRVIRDPGRVESPAGEVPGLDLLQTETVFAPDKATHQTRAQITGGPGWLAGLAGQVLEGYEIHMGRTVGMSPWLQMVERNGAPAEEPDGAADAEGRAWGCYLHGLFGNTAFRREWLRSLGWAGGIGDGSETSLDEALDRLADAVEGALDRALLDRLAGFS